MNIKDVLTAKYDRNGWRDLLCYIFKSKAIIYDSPTPVMVKEELAKEAFHLGEIKLSEYEKLAVYEVELANNVDIVRNRRGIRDMLTSDWRSQGYVGAFVLTFRKRESILRFSYISEYYYFNDEGEYTKKTTDTKRYTYLLGEDFSCRTAVEQFEKLSKSNQTLADITAAFSVEALSKEFFSKYKDHYAHFVDYMADTPALREEFIDKDFNRTSLDAKQIKDREEKPIRDYVKKLLGRIVFLHFLQKKGWLGVPSGKEWGEGDRNFMLNLFNKASDEQKQNFLDGVLEPLFADALDTDRKADNHLFDTKVEGIGTVRIPYLNGGLFERDELDEKPCSFPPKLFDALLETFSQYNFTIDENDPNDAEVGIDPEMLGRIFENLLEDNKDKGAYYTPKEIVQYMCRESLIAYLQTDENAEVLDGIRQFVTKHDANELTASLHERIKDKLCNVKICDPAIGSGAFPMGLLRELFFCRCALDQHLQEKAADIKRGIIQENIYGVDIERGAVDIARLRFWLSLVVDEKDPNTLPNLDFKIMQGNSLLESYKGVDLSDLLKQKIEELEIPNRQLLLIDDEIDVLRKSLNAKINKYFSCGEHLQRQQLRHDIEDLVRKQLQVKGYGNVLGDVPIYENSEFFLWHTWFNDVFSREGKEGFDIVIGNPPYLEARNPSFSENMKVSYQKEISLRCPYDADAFPRGADLLIYFYELSLRLLHNEGYNVFITENSWLATDYGKRFQSFLLKRCEVHALIDSEYKYFENAEVNTVITFLRRKREKEDVTSVKFFHCNGSLQDYPCNTFSDNNTENVSLKYFISSDTLLSTFKWGIILKADKHLLSILESLSRFEDIKLRKKIRIGQGLNVTKNHIRWNEEKTAVPYYTSQDGATYRWDTPLCYIDRNVISPSREIPKLIMPRGIGTHFCSVNNCSGYSSSYVEVYGDLTKNELLNIWLFCNSSICWLLREISGRTNLGGGLLKAEATDLKCLPICFNFNAEKEISDIYESVEGYKLSSQLEENLSISIHQSIDHIVNKFLGIEKESQYITSSLTKNVTDRMKKSKSK